MGHADALSVSLALDGRPVLVDPGTYLYGSGGAWRDWFRSTPAHNTLNIEGESQSIMSGAFNWSHKARATLDESRPEPDWRLRASHDGYARRFGGTHERSVELVSGGIRITDHLLGSHHVAEIAFQLAPGLTARADGRTVTVRDAAGPLLLIQFPDDAIVISVGREDDPSSGWVSRALRHPQIRIAPELARHRRPWRRRDAAEAGSRPSRSDHLTGRSGVNYVPTIHEFSPPQFVIKRPVTRAAFRSVLLLDAGVATLTTLEESAHDPVRDRPAGDRQDHEPGRGRRWPAVPHRARQRAVRLLEDRGTQIGPRFLRFRLPQGSDPPPVGQGRCAVLDHQALHHAGGADSVRLQLRRRRGIRRQPADHDDVPLAGAADSGRARTHWSSSSSPRP